MPHKYSSIIYFYNSGSSNQKRARSLYEGIKKSFGKSKCHEVEVLTEDVLKSISIIEKHAKAFDNKTLVLIGGGDGTVNFVISTVLSSKSLSKTNKKCIFLPLWGGNANDMAVMLNGHPKSEGIMKIIEAGIVKAVYPLIITLTPRAGPEESRLVMGYASFGITAYAIKVMERSSKRVRHRILSVMPFLVLVEFLDFLKAFMLAEPFLIVSKDDSQQVHERLFINGPRIAKIERFPARLDSKEYYATSSNKRRFYVNAVRAIVKPDPSKITSKISRFRIADSTLCQVDGETIVIEPDTKVEVGINSEPFFALSSRESK